MKYVSLFSGIGAFEKALGNLGVEIDELSLPSKQTLLFLNRGVLVGCDK